MAKNERWLLPEGIEEILPAQAERLEGLRRQLLDTYHSWGYELVMPPQFEYLESLLTGTGNDLGLQTLKVTDQLTGRLMGLRADMTPQVARIDAHHLHRQGPSRLCYMGTVLKALPEGAAGSRSPLQVGAELYGHSGPESDAEVIQLMLTTLHTCGVQQVHIDLGHVGIYRGLVKQAGLNTEQESALFDALQRKAKPEIRELLLQMDINAGLREMLNSLADLNGGAGVIEQAAKTLQAANAEVQQALQTLTRVADLLHQSNSSISVHYDLAELRGYHYHTGIVFAAYVPGQSQAVAHGGRYDDIGEVFGRARAATGFSTDLKTLVNLQGWAESQVDAILAPYDVDLVLQARISELRAEGERVIQELPGQTGDVAEMGCRRKLIKQAGDWIVQSL
ncbi:MAG: ATP phosphoribosyltransferase regulatory subunit [Gammaproteobacteria bacterium]|nr:ATP phosphoribosyltransferase regulatory subunit [Gammaproteobacteria bacterium]